MNAHSKARLIGLAGVVGAILAAISLGAGVATESSLAAQTRSPPLDPSLIVSGGESTNWTQNADQLAKWVAHDPALNGAIDLHWHGDPDGANIVGQYLNTGQSAHSLHDGVDMALIAKASGMRGFVLKQKQDQTAALALIIRKVVPGIEVYGGIGLGRVYGVNPVAVEHMAEVIGGLGRLVWMVTNDSVFEAMVDKDTKRMTVPVSKNGELLPETKAVIATIAKLRTRDSRGELVMATGHNSPEEVLMLVREGQRVGARMLVNHANHDRPAMAVTQMQEAAKMGAYIEICATDFRNPNGENYKSAMDAIRTIGPDHIVMATDVGRQGAPSAPQALANAAKVLRTAGFTEAQLDRMFKENPARVLGIPYPAPR